MLSLNNNIQDRIFEESKKDGKKWFMKGEVTAADTVDKVTKKTALEDKVDITSRHVGLSGKSTLTQEDIETYLNWVIDNKAYSNPERKVKKTEEVKKVVEISGEKSKLSLVDEYLNAFKRDEECLKLKGDAFDEIRRDMKILFEELDTLFHTNYTPIRPTSDVQIIFNNAQDVIEESNVFAAPENPTPSRTQTKDWVVPAERTKTDRKRLKKNFGEQKEKKKPKTE